MLRLDHIIRFRLILSILIFLNLCFFYFVIQVFWINLRFLGFFTSFNLQLDILKSSFWLCYSVFVFRISAILIKSFRLVTFVLFSLGTLLFALF